MVTLTFDSSPHAYRMDGTVVPGITTVLRAVGLTGDVEADLGARAAELMVRGRRVHEAIHADLEGDLDESSLDPGELGKVLAARAFLRDTRMTVVSVETVACHETMRYATCIDVIAKDPEGLTCVVNWKGTGCWPHYALQSAGEAMCAPHGCAGMPTVRRLGVHLHPDGAYRLREYKDYEDYLAWRACVTLYHWKTKTAHAKN